MPCSSPRRPAGGGGGDEGKATVRGADEADGAGAGATTQERGGYQEEAQVSPGYSAGPPESDLGVPPLVGNDFGVTLPGWYVPEDSVTFDELRGGTLFVDERGCLRDEHANGFVFAPAWPSGYGVTMRDGEYVVLDEGGEEAGRTREHVQMSGAASPSLGASRSGSSSGQEEARVILESCSGPFLPVERAGYDLVGEEKPDVWKNKAAMKEDREKNKAAKEEAEESG